LWELSQSSPAVAVAVVAAAARPALEWELAQKSLVGM
jgi:hypothetical protein